MITKVFKLDGSVLISEDTDLDIEEGAADGDWLKILWSDGSHTWYRWETTHAKWETFDSQVPANLLLLDTVT